MVVLIVILSILIMIGINIIINYYSKKRDILELTTVRDTIETEKNGLNNSLKGYFFSPNHIWASLDKYNYAKIGFDSFFVKITGQIKKLQVPEIGEYIEKNTKTVTVNLKGDRNIQVTIPIEGEIVEINEEVLNNPEILLHDQYSKGWILKIKATNFIDNILFFKAADDAQQWIRNEIKRLREMLLSHVKSKDLLFQTLADGGVPIDGISGIVNYNLWTMIKKIFFNDVSYANL